MVMLPTTAQPSIEQFMVPVGPTGKEDPPLGWPDGVQPPPPPLTGVSETGSGTLILGIPASLGVTPGELIGGAVVAEPYWTGAVVVSNTATSVTVSTPAGSPQGVLTQQVAAGVDDDTSFTVSQPVGSIQSITRVSDGALLAPDGSAGWASGIVDTGAATPPIQNGDIVEIKYTPAFSGPVPAGVAFTIAKPKAPVTGLSTGTAWAGAYRALVAAGSANGVPPVDALLAAPEAAMKAVVDVMMSVPGLAPVALAGGALAFWGAVAAAAPAIFPGSLSVIPPAGLASLPALMTAAGVSAIALPIPDPWTPASSQAAAALFAGALYTGTLGALVVFPGPSAFPFL